MSGKKQSKKQPERILEYLQAKEWEYEADSKGNWKVKVCVLCGNDHSNLEIQQERGYFKCWACGETGSFYELRKHLGDVAFVASRAGEPEDKPRSEDLKAIAKRAKAMHKRIWERPQGLDYLKDRGFSDKTIKEFKFGCYKKDGVYWLTIPHLVLGEAVNLKYRSLPPEKKVWKQELNSRKVLFNQDIIADCDELILTEGELKSAALWQMGFKNTISLTGGVENFQPEWVDQLLAVKKIYLCLDSDDAGQGGAEKLAMRLGPERCFNIVLPDAKDPDEYFFKVGHTADDFAELMKQAKRQDVRNIVSVNQALKQLQHRYETEDIEGYEGLQTPWPNVNKLLGGMKGGDFIVLGSPPKVGKTTWALGIALYQADLGNPVLFMCLEMNAERLAKKIACNVGNVEVEMLDVDHIAMVRHKLRKRPLYLVDQLERGSTTEDLFESMRASYRRYGLKMIVFDNIHFAVRSADNLREKLGELSQSFKLLAEELKIPIMVIVHPRKIYGNKQMTAADFRETGAIHADADQVIILHREHAKGVESMTELDKENLEGEDHDDEDKEPLLSPLTYVIVDSSRDVEGGRSVLWFEGAKSKYRLKTEEDG